MIQRTGWTRWSSLAMTAIFGLTIAVPALADEVTLKKGADVHLVFDSSLSSKTAKEGDRIKFHVEKDVDVDGKTVIKEGTKVAGTVKSVHGRGRYGVNARVQLLMDPIRSVSGKMVGIQPKTRGQDVGNRTGEAAGASTAGLIVLGPLGLGAGYFIVGKEVNAKPGSKTTVEVSKDIMLNVP